LAASLIWQVQCRIAAKREDRLIGHGNAGRQVVPHGGLCDLAQAGHRSGHPRGV
jgi:hypothetical protein